jgi:hypothetical protein
MDDDEGRVQVGAGYPLRQLAQALLTAAENEDPRARQQAEQRVRRWQQVLDAMATGRVQVGSRAPLSGLPAWVTPEVLRGGFATGKPAASGPLRPHEADLARRVGLPMQRQALFAYHLTEAGLADLDATLDHGRYRVGMPEEAGLLVIAWLLRSTHRSAALTLLDTLAPYAERLRFTPQPATLSMVDPATVWRETVGEVRERVAARRANPRIAAVNEALTVWNPFGDQLLRLWLDTVADGWVAERFPDDWVARSAGLLDRYAVLAVKHPHCSKHRRPKENLAILRAAAEEMLATGELTPRRRGLLQHAVDSMLRRRGEPGSPAHTALRSTQQHQAARPTHHVLAAVVADRLAPLRQDVGASSVDELTVPVTATEADEYGVPPAAAVPKQIRKVVARARAGTLEELIGAGAVPSAEILAGLVPQIAATVTAGSYPDPVLGRLMAAHYRAFRGRRSLLLLDLQHQIRIEELPWVAAVADARRANRRDAALTLTRVATLALDAFPATVLPNPLIRELAALAAEAGLDVPWVEELAADIFMGTFSAKFTAAAKLAATLLDGSLYQRYYGIDYRAVAAIGDVKQRRGLRVRTSVTFDTLCRQRAGNPTGRWSVAANGTIIEQAQILTTHNLATLAGPAGVVPTSGWTDLARRSLRTVCRLVARVHHNPRPLPTIKDAAYAWRHMVLYLSLAGAADRAGFLGWAREQILAQPRHVELRLQPAVDGLAHILAGGEFDTDATDGGARRFLGWCASQHWMGAEPVDLGTDR